MKRGKRGRGRKASPKQSLNLPDLDQTKSAVLNSLPGNPNHTDLARYHGRKDRPSGTGRENRRACPPQETVHREPDWPNTATPAEAVKTGGPVVE